jgi:hypothetical protein
LPAETGYLGNQPDQDNINDVVAPSFSETIFAHAPGYNSFGVVSFLVRISQGSSSLATLGYRALSFQDKSQAAKQFIA